MPRICYQGSTYEAGGQSVLDCLTAQGQAVPSACRAGVCQSCLMRAVRGGVPEQAQRGLTATMVARNLFLACQCFPAQDLEVALADDVIERIEACVAATEVLSDEIRAVHIRPLTPFEYRAGQFVRLFMDARTSRNYSLASVPTLDDDLMMHVRRVPGGQVSAWIFDRLKPGDTVTISEAFGDCFYVPGRPEQNLLLLGTGCGLAPLYGIVRDALNRGHRGRIHLYHGSRDACGLYLVEELNRLAAVHRNFHYRPCISEGPSPDGYWAGTPLQAALDESPDLSGWRVYLCGNPQMVEAARMQTFLAGAGSSEIFADPFLPSGIAPTPAPNG
ncbi:MAG: 2Fe-2S iron-sulfur cluster-binding protein [Steroidobacteraceae bacterium]